jgi:hypothetical protein
VEPVVGIEPTTDGLQIKICPFRIAAQTCTIPAQTLAILRFSITWQRRGKAQVLRSFRSFRVRNCQKIDAQKTVAAGGRWNQQFPLASSCSSFSIAAKPFGKREARHFGPWVW